MPDPADPSHALVPAAGRPPGPWYQAGLRFSCTQCGNCCTGAAGFTWVDDQEVTGLARHLGLDEPAFRRRYTRTVWRDGVARTSLVEQRGGDCVFYARGTGCTVYAQRPRQCRTWPFWGRIVATEQDWQEAARECPGMGQGALHAAEAITADASSDGLS